MSSNSKGRRMQMNDLSTKQVSHVGNRDDHGQPIAGGDGQRCRRRVGSIVDRYSGAILCRSVGRGILTLKWMGSGRGYHPFSTENVIFDLKWRFSVHSGTGFFLSEQWPCLQIATLTARLEATWIGGNNSEQNYFSTSRRYSAVSPRENFENIS